MLQSAVMRQETCPTATKKKFGDCIKIPDIPCRWHETTLQERIKRIVLFGREYFYKTELTDQNQELTPHSVEQVRKFMILVAPRNPDYIETGKNWFTPNGPWHHILRAAKIDAAIAELVDTFSPGIVSAHKMEIIGLLHDLGRLICHDFYATDELTDYLLREIGIREDIVEGEHCIGWYWNVDEPLDLNGISLEQSISVLSDVLAKPSNIEPCRLRKPCELIEAVRRGKEKYKCMDLMTAHQAIFFSILEQYAEREECVLAFSLNRLKEIHPDMLNFIEEALDRINAMDLLGME